MKNKQLQYSLDQAELKQSSLLEENSSFSIKVLSLEQQLEELQERLHKVMQKDDSQQTPTLKASPTRPSIHNDETKALKRSLDGLRQELERREDWISVLKEHIKVKDRSLRDIKKAYVDLHSKQQSQIDSLIDKLKALLDDKRLLQKRFLQLCQPNSLPDIRMSVQIDRGMSGKDSPVLDTLKRSQLLYQSIDKTRAWNIGKFEDVRGGDQDSLIQSSLDLNRKNRYLNTINLMPLRSSIGESLYRTSIKSNRKSTTVKKIRGGNTIQQFDPQCEDEDPDEP